MYNNKYLFWNVDTQNDFMNKDGALYVPDAESIKPTLKLLTSYARKNKIQIISTGDLHDESSKEISSTPDFITTFPRHCMIGEPGPRPIQETTPLMAYTVDWLSRDHLDIKTIIQFREIHFWKDHFDIFQGNPHASRIVEALEPRIVIGYGVAGNVCVDYAFQGLLKRGFEIYAVKDAIRCLPFICSDEEQFAKWEHQGIKCIESKDLDSIILRR